jgi:2-(1,2-epoxy-1,2-dihydrophenyl)acetyl-CoA isomerase
MADGRPVEEQVTYEVTDSVATITLNAPEQGNALSPEMRDRVGDLFDEASADLFVRAILLTGAGERHFCTGANLGAPQPAPPRPEGAPDQAVGDVARLVQRGWQRLITTMLDCDKPIVGAVNGTAAGGGAQLVLACDLVLMAEGSRFIEVFVKRGIVPDAGAAYLLPRLVGPHLAKEMLFLGDAVSAEEAHRIGLANRVVPAAALATEARAVAERLAAGPTRAIAMTKWLVNRSFESSRHTAFDEEAYAQDLVNRSADFGEGLDAFRERRDPQFRGW